MMATFSGKKDDSSSVHTSKNNSDVQSIHHLINNNNKVTNIISNSNSENNLNLSINQNASNLSNLQQPNGNLSGRPNFSKCHSSSIFQIHCKMNDESSITTSNDATSCDGSSGSDNSQSHTVPGTENQCRSSAVVPREDDKIDDSPNEEDVEDDLEDDTTVVAAESPDGRWQRRNQTVDTNNIPGIDAAYMAIDTEEGVEVVWNEMDIFTNGNDAVLRDIEQFFDKLTKLNHPNVVGLYNYWIENRGKHVKVFFVTEYMSTGSLKVFLKKTWMTKQALSRQSWRRWCIQLLSALDYLHCCTPPIIHGMLSPNTVFIQNNGLIKIGSISPDTIANRIQEIQNCLCIPSGQNRTQEMSALLDMKNTMSESDDIYMFGLVALEMLSSELNLKSTSSNLIDEETIANALSNLDTSEKNFILSCLKANSLERPTARQLLHHPAIFQIYSLRLLSAHALINHWKHQQTGNINQADINPATMIEENLTNHFVKNKQIGKLFINNIEVASTPCLKQTAKQDLCNFLEAVRSGQYPLAAYYINQTKLNNTPSSLDIDADDNSGNTNKLRGNCCRGIESYSSSNASTITTANINSLQNRRLACGTMNKNSEQVTEPEFRRIANIQKCNVEKSDNRYQLTIQFILIHNDERQKMRRNLTTYINSNESSKELTEELLKYGFICKDDCLIISQAIDEALDQHFSIKSATSDSSQQCSSNEKKDQSTYITSSTISSSMQPLQRRKSCRLNDENNHLNSDKVNCNNNCWTSKDSSELKIINLNTTQQQSNLKNETNTNKYDQQKDDSLIFDLMAP